MSVVSLAIHAGDDPLGATLATLTDNDVETFEMRVVENSLGSASFRIRRDHASATATNLAAGNYVTVTIPVISGSPVFGFWLDDADDTIVGNNEEADETLTRGGQSSLAVLGRAALLDDFYNGSIGGEARGNTSIPGFWTWTAEPYGAILVRLLEEGFYEPGTPLADVTWDFNRTDDSNGDAWPDIIETIQFDIGTDGLTVYERLIASGHLFVVMDPDLSLHGYGSAPGTNRASGSFGSGKVRFVKGTNIDTELVRKGEGVDFATHALVRGKDYKYVQVVSPDYSPGDAARWTTVDYPETNDPDLLEAAGLRELARLQLMQDSIEFEISPGDTPLSGKYLPFKHFDVGDRVTVHTGSDPWDYNEQTLRLIGFRVVLDETASDDSTTDLAARSLHTIVEVSGGPSIGALRVNPQTSGCGPCPGDFPWVPNERGHYASGSFSYMTEGGGTSAGALATIPHPVNSTTSVSGDTSVTLTLGVTYNYHFLHTLDSADLLTSHQVGLHDGSTWNSPHIVDSAGVATVLHEGSFTCVSANAGTHGVSADAPGASHVAKPASMEWWIDPVGWDPGSITPPRSGQDVGPEVVTMTGASGTTAYPFADYSLHVYVDNLDETGAITSQDGSTGAFTLGFTPKAGEVVKVTYVRRAISA